jgi:hypothetical protein
MAHGTGGVVLAGMRAAGETVCLRTLLETLGLRPNLCLGLRRQARNGGGNI